jgi:plastocyanin
MRREPMWLAASLAMLAMLACSDHAAPTETSGATISVEDNRFTPPQFVVTAGGTAAWTWSGNNPHNVTFDDGPTSATQQRGRFQRQFTAAGVYRYHCTIHGLAMSGTVEVR